MESTGPLSGRWQCERRQHNPSEHLSEVMVSGGPTQSSGRVLAGEAVPEWCCTLAVRSQVPWLQPFAWSGFCLVKTRQRADLKANERSPRLQGTSLDIWRLKSFLLRTPGSAFFDLGLGSSSCHTQQLGGHTPLGDAGSMGTTFPGASAHRSPVPVANVR